MKRFAIICVLLVVITFAVAAGGQAATEATGSEQVTLTMMARNNAYQGPWEDYEIFQALEEQTGIQWEFILASEAFEEKKNLALATGDLPDVFLGALTLHDEETYGPQGELIPLNDLIDRYGPNIKKCLAQYPLLDKAITASDGNIYALGQVTFTQTQGGWKMYPNTEWLDNLGMAVPATIDEFHAMLKAFKENDPDGNKQDDTTAMTDRGFSRMNGWLMCAFGETFGTGHGALVNVKGNTVSFTPWTEGYKAYITFLSRIYSEGLLDSEFLSQSAEEYIAKTKSMKYGFLGHPSQADWTQFQVAPPLTSSLSSQKIATGVPHYATGGYAITKVNEHPRESLEWVDLLHRHYSDGVNGLSGVSLWLGQQSKHWDVTEDGTAISYILEPEGELSHWLTFLKRVGPGGGVGYRVMDKAFTGAYQGWVAEGNVTYAFPYQKDERLYPGAIRFTAEQTERLSILRTDISTYVDQMQAKFVVGQEPLTNWDTFVDTLKKMKTDEYVSILQAGFDRYNK